MIQAVLFDFGETLLTFGRLNTSAMFKEGARLSYDYLKSLNQPVPAFTSYLLENLFYIRLRHTWSFITGKDFDSTAVLRTIGTRRGFKLTSDQWDQVAWLWYQPLSLCAVAEPDIRETLKRLADMGLKLGIVSNTFLNHKTLDRHLDQFGILEFFPTRLYSYEVPWRKPSINIFLEAARRINTAPENIVFVGDRIDNDVQGALKAKMIPVLKSAYTNHDQNTPPNIPKIDRLTELPTLITNMRGA